MQNNEIVRALRKMLPPKVDYAELVCAEGFAHGQCYVWDDPEPYIISAAADMIESLQAQLNDAVPVVRGEWIRMDETQALLSVEWKCSQCGQDIRVDGIFTAIGAGWKYCPNCGAKMK